MRRACARAFTGWLRTASAVLLCAPTGHARPAPGPRPVIQDANDRGAFWEIVPQLRSPDRQTVFHAAWALVDIGDETCVGALAAGPGPALEAEREATAEQMKAASEILRLRLAGGAQALEGLARSGRRGPCG